MKPRICSAPRGKSPKGKEAVELAAACGLVLDPWQAYALERSLVMRAKKWAAFEVGLVVARQNGKDAVLEARELAGIFVLGEQLIIHSAHLVDTSLEHQHRLLDLIEESDLQREIKTVRRANGQEAIEFKNGGRIRFRTRTKGGGRGFSADLVVLNEAMMIPLFSHASLLPTLSARPNPQIWYVGSAVDRLVHDDGHVLASVRQRGIEKQKGLAYFEWSLEGDNPDLLDEKLVSSPKAWLQANPALGIRITPEHVALEQASLDDRAFAVERLGIGDWPPVGKLETVIPLERWDELTDMDSRPLDPVVFAFDTSPARSFSTIAVAGWREDEQVHVEVVERRRGTNWMVDRLVKLNESHRALGFVVDEKGPAASIVPELEENGLTVIKTNGSEMAQACGLFFDAVEEGSLRHLGTTELRAAIRAAAKRPLGDSWAWSRRASAADISPLVAVTLAHQALCSTPVYDLPLAVAL